jgi:hypothetical protein
MLLHHVIDAVPAADGTRRVTVTVDLTGPQLAAAGHASRLITEERYRLRPLESADDVLALREVTALTDELEARAGHGEIDRMQLTVARLGVFVTALDDFLASRADGVRREGDADALPHLYAIVDGLADAHRDAVAAALGGLSSTPA